MAWLVQLCPDTLSYMCYMLLSDIILCLPNFSVSDLSQYFQQCFKESGRKVYLCFILASLGYKFNNRNSFNRQNWFYSFQTYHQKKNCNTLEQCCTYVIRVFQSVEIQHIRQHNCLYRLGTYTAEWVIHGSAILKM